MSWISENYEKAAIGVGAVAAIGLAWFGWQKAGSVGEDFLGTPSGAKPSNSDPSVKGSDRVATGISSFQLSREWQKGDDNGRPVDLFTGVPLFVNKNNLNNPVDLVDPDVEAVHPPIPNQWWIDNRIDPGFGDSPQRDADGDGFSNLEEFNAKTDPSDNRDYPPLITKLTYAGDEAIQWVLRPGFPQAGGAFTFEYNDNLRRGEKVGAANPIAPGGLFFEDGPIKERFKFVGSEKRKEMNERLDVEVDVVIVTVEDQKPNKKGMTYEIPSQFRKANAAQFAKYDRTAVLSLEALGLEGQEMKVEEFTSFALPPDAKDKSFKLKDVTPESITVEHTNADGKTETFTILKGATAESSLIFSKIVNFSEKSSFQIHLNSTKRHRSLCKKRQFTATVAPPFH